MIKLKCVNDKCGFSYEVTKAELEEYSQYHKYCMICGSLLKVDNLEEIIEKDIGCRAEEHLNKWVAEIGWDNTLDLIKRNKDQACYRIYKELLEKRGFKLKGEDNEKEKI
jgi:hypothetical protein